MCIVQVYGVPHEAVQLLSGTLLSYELAEQGNRTQGLAFVRDAQHTDAGQASAWEHFGIRLETAWKTCLEPGDWRPRREKTLEVLRQASLEG